MAELVLSDDELKALERQPVLLTDNFYPSTPEAEREMALPYGLIFQPFTLIDEKHKDTRPSTELHQCSSCEAVLNCFCVRRAEKVICNLCGHENDGCSLPASNVVDYEYECVNYQAPVLVIAVDITYAKGLELVCHLFQCGAIRDLLQVDGLRVAFVLFGTLSTLVHVSNNHLELITFADNEINCLAGSSAPIITPLEDSYDILYKAFLDDNFRRQLDELDIEYRNLNDAVKLVSWLCKSYRADSTKLECGAHSVFVSFGPDSMVDEDRVLPETIKGRPNLAHLATYIGEKFRSIKVDRMCVYNFFFGTNEFVDMADYEFLAHGIGMLRKYDDDCQSIRVQVASYLQRFQRRRFDVQIKFFSATHRLAEVAGPHLTVEPGMFFIPSCGEDFQLSFSLQLRPASSSRPGNAYFQLQCMSTNARGKTVCRVVTLYVGCADDVDLLEGGQSPPCKLLLLQRLLAAAAKPALVEDSEKDVRFINGIFEARRRLSGLFTETIRLRKIRTLGQAPHATRQLLLGMYLMRESTLLAEGIPTDSRFVHSSLLTSASLSHAMRLLFPAARFCSLRKTSRLAIAAASAAHLVHRAQEAGHAGPESPSVAVITNQECTEIFLLLDEAALMEADVTVEMDQLAGDDSKSPRSRANFSRDESSTMSTSEVETQAVLVSLDNFFGSPRPGQISAEKIEALARQQNVRKAVRHLLLEHHIDPTAVSLLKRSTNAQLYETLMPFTDIEALTDAAIKSQK